MPDLRPAPGPVLAVLCSDIHLQANPPQARSAEPDWWAAMARPLAQLRDLADQHQVPVVIAGDVFDRWAVSPEVVNFALDHLPPAYAVPGQHDLPNHDYTAIKRSAYWTLCRAGLLTNLPPGVPTQASDQLTLWGYPWGHPVKPIKPDPSTDHLAVVHAFLWQRGYGYTGAPAAGLVTKNRAKLRGHTAAVYGDNHKGFLVPGPTPVLNCGGFMPRTTAERTYQPHVGLLHQGGTITRVPLDTSADRWADYADDADTVAHTLDLSAVVDDLGRLADTGFDFRASVYRWLDGSDLPKPVRDAVLGYVDGV